MTNVTRERALRYVSKYSNTVKSLKFAGMKFCANIKNVKFIWSLILTFLIFFKEMKRKADNC